MRTATPQTLTLTESHLPFSVLSQNDDNRGDGNDENHDDDDDDDGQDRASCKGTYKQAPSRKTRGYGVRKGNSLKEGINVIDLVAAILRKSKVDWLS